MKRTKTVELAWAAGFYDGEGCLTASFKDGRGTKIALQVNQINPEPLERFQAAVGAGNIIGPKLYPSQTGNRREMWYYRVTKFADILAVLDALWPFLCEPKKAQAEDVIGKWQNRVLVKPQHNSHLLEV